MSDGAANDPRVAQVEQHLMELRLLFNRHLPFFGHLINNIPVKLEYCDTACVTNEGPYGVIHLDPGFASLLTRGQLGAVMVHEMHHPAFGFFGRLGERDRKLFNKAHDYAINLPIDDMIRLNPKLGLEWPTGELAPLLDQRWTGIIPEQIYEELRQNEDPEQAPVGDGQGPAGGAGNGDGQPGENGGEPGAQGGGKSAEKDGGQDARGDAPAVGPDSGDSGSDGNAGAPGKSGADGAPSPGTGRGGPNSGSREGNTGKSGTPQERQSQGKGYSDHTDCRPSSSISKEAVERLEENWKRLLSDAQTIQQMRGIGNIAGSYQEMVNAILKPKADWRTLLLHEVSGVLRGGGVSYRRPSKRSQALGIAMPGRSRRKPLVGIGYDTSGSVGSEEARNFKGSMRIIADTFDVETLRLVAFDTRVTSDEMLEDFDQFEMTEWAFSGRGGTNFDSVPRYLEEDSETIPDIFVILTDGGVEWPSHSKWPCPVVVVTTEQMPPEPYVGIKMTLG